MPDKEIAGLTAGAAPDGTELFHGVQGGNSRRFTAAQLAALAADPATDDGDTLGTVSKRWSDLFLASGGVVNWANGDVTLTHSANALAFAGGTVSFDVSPTVSGNALISAGDATSTSVAGIAEIATAAEFRAGTDTSRVLGVDEVWNAAEVAALTDAATIAVDFAAGINFGGSSNAVLALGGNRTLGAPSNVKSGQSGVLWFGAATSTRLLTLNAAWLLFDGVEVGPYSITTSQILGVAYLTRGTSTFVTAILRRAA